MAQHIIFVLLCSLALSAASSSTPKKISPAPAKKLAPHDNNIQKLADAIQKHYNQTSSATFNFTQNYKHPFLPTNETSKGQVFFKARNMLWRYQEPADRQKEFYIADKKFTIYNINEKLAYTNNCFDQDTLSASITFLWGKGRLKESFTIKPYTGAVDPKSTLKWLTLIPKEANAPVKSISLGADPKTGLVKESIVIDPSDGINHFVFTNFKSNVVISPATFIFVAKPGVRVQPMPNITCPDTKLPDLKKPTKKS
jgi:outer membrane lipoprotein carrier protein